MNKRAKRDLQLPSTIRAVTYARVSTKEQEREGFSIDAQQKLLAGYAQAKGFAVAQAFVDVETAKQAGRTNFSEMIRFLKRHPDVRILLVEKTDRLYRNFKDWVTIDELDIELHLVKEGDVLSRTSRSSAKFVHGIKVLMAKNYVDNLAEEARKGMQEKAEQGIWPSRAPLGYRNTVGPDGKKIVTVDPELGSVITGLFERYGAGTVSLKELAEDVHRIGLVSRVSGGAVGVSKLHVILRNRFYTGRFEWKGQLMAGRHDPLVSHDLWERVQQILEQRSRQKLRKGPRNFAFSGLVRCGHCDCAMVGEIKKGRYVYYHCTGYKGRCPEPYLREEVLEARFSGLLGHLRFGDDIHAWIVTALRQSLADERREHDAAIGRLKAEHDRLTQRLRAMYVDKLDGRIDGPTYDRLSRDWREEQDRCLREIGYHQSAERSYVDEGVALLTLAKDAQRLFEKRSAADKRKLLNFVLSNSTWKDAELTPEFRQPFDLIAQTAMNDPGGGGGNGAIPAPRSEWWGK